MSQSSPLEIHLLVIYHLRMLSFHTAQTLTFPRLSPLTCAHSKSSLLPRLALPFQYVVGMSHEAPEKEDYGDVEKGALGASARIHSPTAEAPITVCCE